MAEDGPAAKRPRPADAAELDEVESAFARLTGHVQAKGKTGRCAALAAKLFADDKVQRKHSAAAFAFLEALVGCGEARVTAPDCRVDVSALLKEAARASAAGVFAPKHRAWVDAWALLDTAIALHTDDAFEFAKTCGELRRLFAEAAAPAKDAADIEAPPEEAPAAAALDPQEAAEAAAFAARAAAAEAAAAATAAAVSAARCDLLCFCLETAAALYRWPWAQGAVDTLVEAVAAVAARLPPATRDRASATVVAMRDARRRRRAGGDGGGGGGAPTSFERDVARMSTAVISIRTAVGAGTGMDGRGERASNQPTG